MTKETTAMTKETLKNYFQTANEAKVMVEKAKTKAAETRQKAYEAMKNYICAQNRPVLTSELAEIAGCSPQAIFNYFYTWGFDTICPITEKVPERYIKLDEDGNPIPGAIKEFYRRRSAFQAR